GEKVNNRVILHESILSQDELVIKHSMNVFSIEFAALNYFISSKVKYKYMLEGFDKDWMELDGNIRKAVYTNLNAGSYIFKVKACNNDGLWNEDYKQLKITILPPFYASPMAYVIYFVLIAGLLFFYRYSMLKKERIKFNIEQERLQARRNHDMDEMKLRFLTNVSHEFRTPLTLILTPLDKLLKMERDESEKRLLETINRNARHLLDLVNQLLDFRKLDLHGLKYNPSYGDIIPFLNEVCGDFIEGFQRKGINFEFVTSIKQLHFNFDAKKLQKVMMNLISNALKFTPSGGNVVVSVALTEESSIDDKVLIIKVKDSGVGIMEEEQDKIFERFYQSQNNHSLGVSGSGIGLNLAKEMILLHGGNIRVESEVDKGSEFIVSIPVTSNTNAEMESKTIKTTAPVENSFPELDKKKDETKPVLLLIEDNLDFRIFMKDSLQDRFIVHEAEDGVEGFDRVHKIIPDIIISDVMMPNMDGMEMCKKLKADIRTSHIPLILLTARTADEDKIKGLEIGADDYITKPFNMDLLLLRIDNLMDKQNKIQRQFQKNIDLSPSEVEIPSMEEKLIKKAISFVEKNIAEAKFSVEDLSRELGMSRVYLYKKLLAITGKSPVEFIRIIRLKRGAQLLQKSQFSVAEVAYKVGFNSPRYFSKYFKEEYGMLPTDFAKKFGKNSTDKIDLN
ncbi:MAG: response regulator, partial [Bacteroidales bacterium]|nr:response regulator [Bacteroidales bacterium]